MVKRYKLLNQKDTKFRRRQLRKQMTRAELDMWTFLKNKELGYKFRRQHGIGRYIVDFYCPELKLILEIDGGIHGDRIEKDKIKENYLKRLGFNIKRYTNEQIMGNLEAVYNDLKTYCGLLKSLKPSPNPSLEGRGLQSVSLSL